jgi:cytochrome oxidase Cu insertion factor (SCO1/SenC/PrrC family)
VIVNPDGKVAKIFNDNKWKPEEAVDALKQSLASQD